MPARSLPRRSTVLAIAAVLALPVLALADAYTVTLHNGTVFRCRYQPQAAPWDANKLLLRTDVGNWIALKKADLVGIESDAENRGFGKVINNTTLLLGDAPNDAPSGEDAADTGETPEQPNYNINQFVEPGQTQGLPGTWLGNSGGSSTPAPAPAPRPAPKPAAATPPPGVAQ